MLFKFYWNLFVNKGYQMNVNQINILGIIFTKKNKIDIPFYKRYETIDFKPKLKQ
tara:strand:- start:103 stop:267 length:165 start_codon:yes stop_codon:yes gene_type:complete